MESAIMNSLEVFTNSLALDLPSATSTTTTSTTSIVNNNSNNSNNNKSTGANTDVSNVICEAEPSNDNIPSPTSASSPTSSINDGNTSPTIPPQQPSSNNKKRTRATPEQLSILEETFKTNTSPNSKVREALAEKVNMSERSIQIWFQNRRAKMKAMQKRAHLMINQDPLNHFMSCIPPTYGPNIYPFRIPIHPQRIALPNVTISAAAGMRQPASISAANAASNNQPQQQQQLFTPPLQQFTPPPQEFIAPSAYQSSSSNFSLMPCETLIIGSWRRILTIQEPKDLLCFYMVPQNLITYLITNENTRFKMEFPFVDITSIEYQPIDDNTCQLAIEVKDSPKFYMESPQGRWNMCKDFTEDRQASRFLRHVIKGRSAFMKPALIKLMQDDSDLAKVVTIHESPSNSSYPSPSSSTTDNNMINGDNNNKNGNNNNSLDNKNNIIISQLQNLDQPSRRSSYPIPGNNNNNNNNNNFVNGNSTNNNNNDNGLCIDLNNDPFHRIRRSASVPLTPNSDIFNGFSSPLTLSSLSSSPLSLSSSSSSSSSSSTPIDVFDSSPTLIQSSPLLNHPFIGFQSSHNLSNLQMDSETSTILSDEQFAASMISFNDDTSFISSMNLDDASSWINGDVSSFLLEC